MIPIKRKFKIIFGVILLIFLTVGIGLSVIFQRKCSLRQATNARVQVIAADTYRMQSMHNWPILVENHLLWDLNDDGLLDGDPGKDFPNVVWYLGQSGPTTKIPDGFTQQTAPRYQGYVKMTGYMGRIDTHGRPTDPYGRPLRIAFSFGNFGSGGWGIWSDGPDGTLGTADDICSWKD